MFDEWGLNWAEYLLRYWQGRVRLSSSTFVMLALGCLFDVLLWKMNWCAVITLTLGRMEHCYATKLHATVLNELGFALIS
jgi:hypothetical protein